MGNENTSKEQKKFFWFKFGKDFFNQITVKYLETLPDSNKLIIAYLKLILSSLETEGYLRLNGLFPTIEEEIAMLLNQDVNIIRLLIPTLIKTKAVEILDDQTIFILSIQRFYWQRRKLCTKSKRFSSEKKGKRTRKVTK